jgi:hypothetical protein
VQRTCSLHRAASVFFPAAYIHLQLDNRIAPAVATIRSILLMVARYLKVRLKSRRHDAVFRFVVYLLLGKEEDI